jgi:hypothetical protein
MAAGVAIWVVFGWRVHLWLAQGHLQETKRGLIFADGLAMFIYFRAGADDEAR